MLMVIYLSKVPGFTLRQLQMLCSRNLSSSEFFQSYVQRRGMPLMNNLCQKYYHGAFVRNQNCATLYKVDDNLCVSPLWLITRRYYTEKKESKWKLILSEFKHIQRSPKPAVVYGLMGLLPFMCVPIIMYDFYAYIPLLAKFQFVCSALLLSFLGGARWGVAVTEGSGLPPDWRNLGYTIVPPFIGFLSLLNSSSLAGFFFAIPGLTWAAYFDFTQPGYPPWFRSLRLVLTVGVIISFFFTFICFVKLEEKDNTKELEQKKLSPKSGYLKV